MLILVCCVEYEGGLAIVYMQARGRRVRLEVICVVGGEGRSDVQAVDSEANLAFR